MARPCLTALLDLCGEANMEDNSIASLYRQREQQQLGDTFTMVGNLHNVASGYDTGCSSSPLQTDFTRVLTWNVGADPARCVIEISSFS